MLFLYGFLWEPNHFNINQLDFSREEDWAALRGKRIVFITDIHMKSFGRFEKEIIEEIRKIDPDLIFLGGDYIKWKGDVAAALDFLAHLKAPMGSYGVLGDYDYSNSRQSCLFCHQAGKGEFTERHAVKFLRGKAVRIEAKLGSIYVYGSDEKSQIENPFQKLDINPEFPIIVLSHSPLIFSEIKGDRSILILAGDTHGGQVALPQWIFKIFGYQKNSRFNSGLFVSGKKKMYVSRGLGTSHVPIRLFRPPELTVIQF